MIVAVAVVAAVTVVPPRHANAQASRDPAAVWYAPVTESPDLLDLFTRPDLWASARVRIGVFKFVPNQLEPARTNAINTLTDLLRVDAFRQLRRWGISIAIEAPSVKEWDCSGRQAAQSATMRYLKTVHDAGAAVRFIAIDEPLVNGLDACHETFDEIAKNTAGYASSILADKDAKAWTSELTIGVIEAYPSRTMAQIEHWITLLRGHGFKPGFFHLDVDRNDVAARGDKLDAAGDLRVLQAFLRGEGISFGIIFWSGHDPESSDLSYFNDTMSWVRFVHAAIGAPDQAIFQSWVRRSSLSCVKDRTCANGNDRFCGPLDPPTCGRLSVPVNLPEADPAIFSHMRLLDAGIAILAEPAR